MGQHEKQGGNPVTFSQVEGFREAIQTNDLLDLGFVGHSFTWTNGKGGESNIQERLDRAMATMTWKESYPKTVVQHLNRYKSDHSPILVDMEGDQGRRRKISHRYRFEECWLRDENCEKIVKKAWERSDQQVYMKLRQCGEKLYKWGEENFGDITKKIRLEGKRKKERKGKERRGGTVRREGRRKERAVHAEPPCEERESRASSSLAWSSPFVSRRVAASHVQLAAVASPSEARTE
ncbi:hypothetical protein Ahy_B05g074367 [Arachis hypogaea]|uniref:Endonuclease/exonuclease/phosphatase domain-containing protein n=1 Tax=Arachis hypogaea TaxID=3818 RepID=A0A444YYP4_ARAHY|nr:hypothetical protein Ahy_B05g074367 [Arachis hypogaea]